VEAKEEVTLALISVYVFTDNALNFFQGFIFANQPPNSCKSTTHYAIFCFVD
jgi:hypothetical protein